MDNALQVEHLQKNYSDFTLNNITFSLPKGCIMGLIGENGAGKSTTIKGILNLIRTDEGKVAFWGNPLSSQIQKEDIGVVFDQMNFYGTLTPGQLGKIGAAAYRNWDQKTYENYLKRFSLPDKKALKNFSRGMQVKQALAMALSHHAKLLILDEATSGLDPIMRDEILDIFLDFVQDEEHSILISSHITSDLEKIADYITFIHQGNIIFSENKDTLIYNYGILRCGNDAFLALDKTDILACRKMDYQWEVLVADRKAAASKYRNAAVDPATIDEIMLLYVKGERQ
ncbi:ABC transporter ATP-binding protein [Lachnospiraceae bacterium]|nr:ABC transporter ATP-binding protein [Lachnospiraceae bacterium]